MNRPGCRARNLLICCSALANEVEASGVARELGAEVWTVDSSLHLKPERLAAELDRLTRLAIGGRRHTTLVFGECCSHIDDIQARPHVSRTAGVNCAAILLGTREYRRQARAGAFFVLPAWATRWRELLGDGLELPDDLAASLLHESHRKVAYLDTGVVASPTSELEALAAFCDLPLEIYPTPLDRLRTAVSTASMAATGRPCSS